MKLIKYFLIIISFLHHFSSVSQLVFETTTIDFGELNNDSPKFIDVKITNTGVKKAYILNYLEKNYKKSNNFFFFFILRLLLLFRKQ